VEEPVTSGKDPRTAAIIGWAQVTRYEGEPLDAWAEALRQTGVEAKAIDSLDVLYCQSWPYDDPAGRLAEAVGADPKRRRYSGIGGTTPLVLVEEAAERIRQGESDVCAIVGGEALATVRTLKKAGERPNWSHRGPEKKPFPFEAPFHPAEVAHEVFQAYTTFALRDVAWRAHREQTLEQHREVIGNLFAPMTEVAVKNPHAWFPIARTPQELMDVTPGNRVVAHPFTKLVTSIMDVDQSAVLVIASEEAADRLGAEPRVYVRGCGYARDPDYVAEHPDLWRAPGMHTAFDLALHSAGVGTGDIAHFDLYSCFPSSVLFSLDALQIKPDDRRGPFTVTGGLPYAGGPGSCYDIGATAAMADVLVRDPGSYGLLSAVGMHLSKHAAVVLSTEAGTPAGPGAGGARQGERVAIVDEYTGDATVAAYTVHHHTDGSPSDGLLVCDIDGGGRCYARVDDAGFLADLESVEWVGRRVKLQSEGGVNRARQ
jgi:acetyl-CoA C-acetyltransferase